eukprot:gene8433-11410_t
MQYIALDYFFRNFFSTLTTLSKQPEFKNYVLLDGFGHNYFHQVYPIVYNNNAISFSNDHIHVRLSITQNLANILMNDNNVSTKLINDWISCSYLDSLEAQFYIKNVIDQQILRELVKESNGLSFIANNSFLCSINDTILHNDKHNFIPFVGPKSLEKTFYLPHAGPVTGLLIPKGVNVIVGSGFHGKSTLLKAVSQGIYDKIPGHHLQYVVTDKSAFTITIEDGRTVDNVDISPFFDNLPLITGINPNQFSTNRASGSTSMASSVIESFELGSKLLLLDEDTCASNFLIRDSRMRTLIPDESMTPFIYRVSNIYRQLDISTIIVVGGNGDWLDVQTTALKMENYICFDVTKKADSISKAFCTGRIQYNGKGLVHQLAWPHINEVPIINLNRKVENNNNFKMIIACPRWTLNGELRYIEGWEPHPTNF